MNMKRPIKGRDKKEQREYIGTAEETIQNLLRGDEDVHRVLDSIKKKKQKEKGEERFGFFSDVLRGGIHTSREENTRRKYESGTINK